MAKPVILTVDDDPSVLSAVERDLQAHYAASYRVLRAQSGAEGLELVEQLKRRNDPLALFLVDQRMPGMTGVEFLDQARRLYPESRKVLLTAYADTQAAIDSINTIGLDHYLMKPWDPPEEKLYPLLDELLDDWQAEVPIPYDGIRVLGTQWSPASHDVKDFLARNRIPYLWADIEYDEEARQQVDRLGGGQVPLVLLPDGTTLANPTRSELAAQVGLQTAATQELYDLVIIGGGPAGLGAAVYGASEGLRTLMVEREATGGQAGTSSKIENYLGFPRGLTGAELAKRATDQALRFGVEILTGREAVGVRVEDPYRFALLDDGEEIGCRALLIATGVSVRRLDAPGIEALTGAGVFYGAALTEAPYYRGRPVVVVGGANSAGQGAMLFSRYAESVTMLVRGDSLTEGMSQYLIDQLAATSNLTILTNCEVKAAHGEDRLESITIIDRVGGEERTLPASAMFIFIGQAPRTELVEGVVQRNEAGFIPTGPDLLRSGRPPAGWKLKREPFFLETSTPGIFAAGDVRQGALPRVAAAVGSGAQAISLVHRYLKTV